MSTSNSITELIPRPPRPVWHDFARAPLLPIAIAVALGLVVERYGPVALPVSLFVAVGSLVGWLISHWQQRHWAIVWLWIAVGAWACSHHHQHRHVYAADDIANYATDQPRFARLRGTLADEPVHYAHDSHSLFTIPQPSTSIVKLTVTAIETADGWTSASGRVRVTIEGEMTAIHRGDRVEVVGLLRRPREPHNPGEFDYRSHLLDDRIRAEIRCRRSADALIRLESGWRGSFLGWLAMIRGWGTRALRESLPPQEAAVAAALLLGDGTVMARDDWDRFIRTGVVHVLAISGQHLVVLAGFFWLVLRVIGTRRRYSAGIVAAAMILYALVTGANPSAVRAAIMVSVFCGSIMLRRPTNSANALALAWIVVVMIDPTDPFSLGCQLSFLSVFVLIWGLGRWFAARELTPVEQLIEESRTPLQRLGRKIIRIIGLSYAVSLVLWVANAPLILAWQNIVSPVGVVLGPPMIALSSMALIAGFIVLFMSPLGSWASWPFAEVVRISLSVGSWIVQIADGIPGLWLHAPGPAPWWLIGFYSGLVGIVMLSGCWRWYALSFVAAWLLCGLLLPTRTHEPEELRVAFLSVGNGGCVVIETPDGRVLLYDAGTITGPDVVRRVIAPYLWSRGIRRIDEIFISHADLDHYNGVPALLDRFPVGRFSLTPSFRSKPVLGIAETLAAIDRHRIPVRIVQAGDVFQAGDVVFQVLHPPAEGPEGYENARSLVMLVRHGGHTILLTGDLDGRGQAMVVGHQVSMITVMQAPHHGARSANAPQSGARNQPEAGIMASWARPRLVVSCQGSEPGPHLTDSYSAVGAQVWDTNRHGTITIRSHSSGLVAESYRTGELRVVHRGP